MHTLCTYQIEVCGLAGEEELNALSPLAVTVIRADPAATIFTICSDQSGLVGLIRHLHGWGFLLLSVTRK